MFLRTGTHSILLREEWDKAQQIKEYNQQQARLVVDHHRQISAWESGQYEEILSALGIMIGQEDSPARGHDDKRRSRRGRKE